MIAKEEIRKCNEILKDLDAVFPDYSGTYQKFKWQWSTDLYDIVPLHDANGNIQYNFHCSCGKNVRVHSADCNDVIVPITVMHRMQLVDTNGPYASYPNMWMLCRWEAPPLKSDWIDSMGTDADYPSTGSYRPVSVGPVCVVIPPKTAHGMYKGITYLWVDKVKAQAAKNAEDKYKSKTPPLELPKYNSKGEMIDAPAKNAKYWGLKERIKDTMRKFNPASTVGYGQKSADYKVTTSDRSLADYGSPLQKQMAQQKADMAEDLRQEMAKEISL